MGIVGLARLLGEGWAFRMGYVEDRAEPMYVLRMLFPFQASKYARMVP